MAHSFTLHPGLTSPAARRRVLVTGAGGKIGAYFSEHAHECYDLRLAVHHPDKHRELEKFGELLPGDVGDLTGLKKLCDGIDTVVHLAADPSASAIWDDLLPANIIGAYNMFVAAKSAGCRRVIYASSIHAVSGYPADAQVKTSEPVNPGDLYGVTKCFGEAMGRYMAEQQGLSVIALRIGAFQPLSTARDEKKLAMMDAFVSRRDLTQLICRCIDDERLRFAVFHGLSDNRFKRLDITDARELVGYDPQDDFAAENPALTSIHFAEKIQTHSERDPGQKPGIREEV